MAEKDLRAKFNDTTDPSYEFPNQCVCYKRVCAICGYRFKVGEAVCPECGAKRPRCKHRAMAGEEVCRMHSSGRAYSLYTKLAASISDASLEEFMEKPNGDLEQEFALARVALSGALDTKINSRQLMSLTKNFFEIAEKKKNIEKGQQINISWSDELADSLRKRFRLMIKIVNDILKERFDDDVVNEIMVELSKRFKLYGNKVSVKDSNVEENSNGSSESTTTGSSTEGSKV